MTIPVGQSPSSVKDGTSKTAVNAPYKITTECELLHRSPHATSDINHLHTQPNPIGLYYYLISRAAPNIRAAAGRPSDLVTHCAFV